MVYGLWFTVYGLKFVAWLPQQVYGLQQAAARLMASLFQKGFWIKVIGFTKIKILDYTLFIGARIKARGTNP